MLVTFLLSTVLFLSCDARKSVQTSPTTVGQLEEGLLNRSELTEDRLSFYKTDFPKATYFRKNTIPRNMLSELDKGNSVYFDVLDDSNNIIGHLRDFMGPVTDEDDCSCSPLSLTLTYNPDFSLRNILSVAPLQKYGHESLTENEHRQMVEIAKSPSPELISLRAPQDMIDGMSGATKSIYKDKVVDKAGYSTWRISNLAIDSSQIIRGVPIQRDADRLQKMLQGARTDSEQINMIIQFIPTAESNYLTKRALYILADLYLKEMLTGRTRNFRAEEVLLNSGLGDFQEAELLTNVCMAFVEEKMALPFVSSCVQKLELSSQNEEFEYYILIMKGLLLLEQGNVDEAIVSLEKGLSSGNPSPSFRARLAGLYKEQNKILESCGQYESMYIDAPMWPDLNEGLSECGDVEDIKKRLDETRKSKILSDRVIDPKVVSVMQLLDESGKRLEVDFSKGEKLRVVVFFATWCPHCQSEMPRLVEFYQQLQESDLKDKVELVAIRAAITRETQTLDTFKTQYNVPFPILTDEGLVFDNFAVEQGVNAGFPLVAVTNTAGEVEYFPSHGHYNETVKELFWMLSSI